MLIAIISGGYSIMMIRGAEAVSQSEHSFFVLFIRSICGDIICQVLQNAVNEYDIALPRPPYT